ncbi:MAG: hypothetical protein AAF694_07160 [Bacteroidota bacterium]
MGNILFILVLGSTWFMTGVIWFVQVVHYPLFARVGADVFTTYESLHTMRTGWVVAPVMLLELGSTCLLLIERPASLSLSAVTFLVVCTLGVWASTFFLQVPLHGKLIEGGNPEVIQRLVSTNWIRTLLWTAKGLFCLWLLYGLLPNDGLETVSIH